MKRLGCRSLLALLTLAALVPLAQAASDERLPVPDDQAVEKAEAKVREAFRDDPANFDLRPPGKIFMAEYAKYIVHKNQVLGSAGQLEGVRASLGK